MKLKARLRKQQSNQSSSLDESQNLYQNPKQDV